MNKSMIHPFLCYALTVFVSLYDVNIFLFSFPIPFRVSFLNSIRRLQKHGVTLSNVCLMTNESINVTVWGSRLF